MLADLGRGLLWPKLRIPRKLRMTKTFRGARSSWDAALRQSGSFDHGRAIPIVTLLYFIALHPHRDRQVRRNSASRATASCRWC
jgi:hypothetical protein